MIEIQDHGATRLIRLARPPANALNHDLLGALESALREARESDARAVVLSGAPGMFSAGLDVPNLLSLNREDLRAAWATFFSVMRSLAASPIPVAASITGHSPAGGAVLALCCDRRFMAEGRFKIGLNEVRVGLSLSPSLFFALERLVGTRQAENLAVTGRLLDAQEAYEVGLVDELAESPAATEEAALKWAASLSALPRAALAGNRRVARQALVDSLNDADGDVETMLAQWFSEETQAALEALGASLAK